MGALNFITKTKLNTTVFRLLVCSFSLASTTDVMSIFRRQQIFFPLFLLAAAKSALVLTVKCRVFWLLLAQKFNGLQVSAAMCHRQWRRNYGDRGVHCNDCTPSSRLVPPSQRCGLCQNFKQTTLATRLYKVRTNLYPPIYENVPTRLCTAGQPADRILVCTFLGSPCLATIKIWDIPEFSIACIKTVNNECLSQFFCVLD